MALAAASGFWNPASMSDGMLTLLGGIGLFLFGMHTMTEALRALASTQARQMLAGFTRTPLSGAVTGAMTTAAIQSSSATMVTVVGFVGAGLLSFPQAVGVIFGAGIGTTFTGWMVLLLGFRLQLSAAALPVLLAAALVRLFATGQWARTALALAGLSLVFLGIDFMQAGLAGYEGRLTPSDFPEPTATGRLWLVGIGVVVTLVTQSSSAGVAGTLVLLGSGALDFQQGAALVVGMHVGTTFTAILAALGGTHAVRQTALANLLYHLASGAVGLALIDAAALMPTDPQLRLVLFHTLFNLIGTAMMLPVAARFAAMVEWLVPAPSDHAPIEPPDRRLLSDPDAALDMAGATLVAAGNRLFAVLAKALGSPAVAAPASETPEAARASLAPVLEETGEFLARIALPEDRPAARQRMTALLLELDHLLRLSGRAGQGARMRGAQREARLSRHLRLLAACLAEASAGGVPSARLRARLDRLTLRLGRMEAQVRHATLRRPPHVIGLTPADILRLSDAVRWMRRSAHHVQRILEHRVDAAAALPATADPENGAGAPAGEART